MVGVDNFHAIENGCSSFDHPSMPDDNSLERKIIVERRNDLSVNPEQHSFKMKKFLGIFLVLGLFSFVYAENEDGDGTRKGKILNLFSIIRFPNSVCAGDALNGTCYAAEECSSRGGVQSGTCASGYGVCCTCEYIKSFAPNIFFILI